MVEVDLFYYWMVVNSVVCLLEGYCKSKIGGVLLGCLIQDNFWNNWFFCCFWWVRQWWSLGGVVDEINEGDCDGGYKSKHIFKANY
jgi:hypothetical protein